MQIRSPFIPRRQEDGFAPLDMEREPRHERTCQGIARLRQTGGSPWSGNAEGRRRPFHCQWRPRARTWPTTPHTWSSSIRSSAKCWSNTRRRTVSATKTNGRRRGHRRNAKQHPVLMAALGPRKPGRVQPPGRCPEVLVLLAREGGFDGLSGTVLAFAHEMALRRRKALRAEGAAPQPAAKKPA